MKIPPVLNITTNQPNTLLPRRVSSPIDEKTGTLLRSPKRQNSAFGDTASSAQPVKGAVESVANIRGGGPQAALSHYFPEGSTRTTPSQDGPSLTAEAAAIFNATARREDTYSSFPDWTIPKTEKDEVSIASTNSTVKRG
jgi:hypothetical protein